MKQQIKRIENKRTDNKQRVLLYDIETSYTVGAVWGLYDQNVAGVLREPYIISFAWKWLGDKTTQVLALSDFKTYKRDQHCDKELVKELHKLFEQADVIVAHNGNSFDQKWTYSRFIVNGFTPPSPAKYIDTKLVAKSKFRFNSNSLNNLGKYFGCGQKLDTGGIQLWIDCIEHKDPRAWAKMCKYNKQDVVLLEQVYLKMLPYMTNHPSHGGNCTNCGMSQLEKRGFSLLQGNFRAQRYQCKSCGAWQQGKKEKTQ